MMDMSGNTTESTDSGTALHFTFCLSPEWMAKVPDEVKDWPEAVWLQASREQRMPAYFRVCGKASPAAWSRKEISSWFFGKWSISHPGCIKALILSGFPEPEQFGPIRSRLERRKKNVTVDDILKAVAALHAENAAAAKAEKAALEKQRKKRKAKP